MKILLMASGAFAVPSLHKLFESSHKVVMVVTQPDKPAGRGLELTPCPTAAVARELGIEVYQPTTLKIAEVQAKLKSAGADIFVVIAYGKFLPNDVLAIPPKKCVNLHSSLLPKYRGAAPINWAIIRGEEKTGVTTMYINDRMDAGDILMQCATEIDPTDTAETLHDHLAVMGAELLVKTLAELEKGDLVGVPQDETKVTFAPVMTRDTGKIDWYHPAVEIFDLIRGTLPWPKAYTLYNGEQWFIFDSAFYDMDVKGEPGTVVSLEKGVHVKTSEGVLCILELQRPGKKRMFAADFLKGVKIKVGDRLT